jgi:adenylate cyclase
MEVPHLERKLVAILAADIEGFSSHMERNEVGTLAVLSSHRLIIDASIAEFGGRITSTAGDSVLTEFASVVSVINCAVQIQDLLADENAALDEAKRLFLRIGINVGDVMMKNGDIFGDGVNIAARLESLAEPGGICVSRGVRDHLRNHPIVFADLGEQKVKNIAQPVRAFKVRMGEAPDELVYPVLETTRVDGPSIASPSLGEDVGVELAFWDSIKDSGSVAELDAYLARYPDGPFNALARTRRDALVAVDASGTPAKEDAWWSSWLSGKRRRTAVVPPSSKPILNAIPKGSLWSWPKPGWKISANRRPIQQDRMEKCQKASSHSGIASRTVETRTCSEPISTNIQTALMRS